MSRDAAARGPLELVSALERDGGYHAWAQALVLADAVKEAFQSGGPVSARAVLQDAVAQSRLDPTTLRGRVKCTEFLRDHGLTHLAEVRILPIGIAAKITNYNHATDRDKAALLEEYHGVLVAHPGRRGVRAEVGRRLQALRVTKVEDEDWQRHGDRWNFDSFDPRLGRDGQLGRLPGQAALNLVHRFLPAGGSVVSAGCGSGTVLDACALHGVTDHVGLDLRLDARIAERHPDRFRKFDVTSSVWDSVCEPGKASLVVVTPPAFAFGRTAETAEVSDLGCIRDPEDWIFAMERVLAGATRALAVGGVLAVTVRATAEFENGTPVPDLRAAVGRVLDSLGYEVFLANPVISVGRSRARTHDGAWLVPEVVQVVVMRKT